MSIKFPICLQINVGLNLSKRHDDAHLRPDADDSGFERAKLGGATGIGADLLIKVTDRSEENLFRNELRSAPV